MVAAVRGTSGCVSLGAVATTIVVVRVRRKNIAIDVGPPIVVVVVDVGKWIPIMKIFWTPVVEVVVVDGVGKWVAIGRIFWR